MIINQVIKEHTFWNNDLFKMCKEGRLTLQDIKYIFTQYQYYSKDFTRYLAGTMAGCSSPHLRNKLIQNLFEESGGNGEIPHSILFQNFLDEIGAEPVEAENFTQSFVRTYLVNSNNPDNLWSSTWLTTTEAIVAEMYNILVEGMLKAGINEEKLTFFYVHMECDDEHAATLEEIVMSYKNQNDWEQTTRMAATYCLNARTKWFNNLAATIIKNKQLVAA